MLAKQSEFKNNNTKDIQYGPEKTNLVYQEWSDKIHE